MDRILAVSARLTVAGESLDVLAYELAEALSELPLLSCEVVIHDDVLPDPAGLIGQASQFELRRAADEEPRCFVGEVIRAATQVSSDGVPHLLLEIAPRLWRLKARADCRVFREKNVKDIVSDVLVAAGILADEQSWQLSETYPVRDYTAQYRETDWDFVQRLLAEEGIYFSYQVAEERAQVVFTDSSNGIDSVAGNSTLAFLNDFGAAITDDHVFRLQQTLKVKSDKVLLRDYDFARPRVPLESQAEGTEPGEHSQEVYVYPGRFSETNVGDRLANVLCEALQAERTVVSGDSGAITLVPGFRFSIEDHPYEALNQEYLVIRASIRGFEQRQFALGEGLPFGYQCKFEAVPANHVYRAPRREAARPIPGVQTAWTTGASGDEIHTNEHGQVTAKFHWDRLSPRDETASTWMRTSQLPTGGSMLLPRVGWEVGIRYAEGDADRPFVMERLYNTLTPPPYALPENAARSAIQTATTPGGGSSNEIRMSDTKGQEEMFFNASRDMSVQVGNNTTNSIGNDHAITIGSNRTVQVTDSVTNSVGSNHSLEIGGNQSVAVATLMVDDVAGSHSLSIGGNRNQMIGGDHRRTVGGSSSLSVGANEINLVAGAVSDSTLGSFTHNVSAALVEITSADRSLTVGGARSETTGAAKIILCKGGRGVEAGLMSSQTGGAVITSIKGDRVDKAGAAYTETVGGAQIVKAKNAIFEAEQMLSLTMGGASISLTPASVAITGASIKLDGNVIDLGIVMDN